jgi:hypothetical protein
VAAIGLYRISVRCHDRILRSQPEVPVVNAPAAANCNSPVRIMIAPERKNMRASCTNTAMATIGPTSSASPIIALPGTSNAISRSPRASMLPSSPAVSTQML